MDSAATKGIAQARITECIACADPEIWREITVDDAEAEGRSDFDRNVRRHFIDLFV